jgi:hypothetical protein
MPDNHSERASQMAVQQNTTSRFHNLSDAALADELGPSPRPQKPN